MYQEKARARAGEAECYRAAQDIACRKPSQAMRRP